MRNGLSGLRRLDDLDAVRDRAERVLKRLEEGRL